MASLDSSSEPASTPHAGTRRRDGVVRDQRRTLGELRAILTRPPRVAQCLP